MRTFTAASTSSGLPAETVTLTGVTLKSRPHLLIGKVHRYLYRYGAGPAHLQEAERRLIISGTWLDQRSSSAGLCDGGKRPGGAEQREYPRPLLWKDVGEHQDGRRVGECGRDSREGVSAPLILHRKDTHPLPVGHSTESIGHVHPVLSWRQIIGRIPTDAAASMSGIVGYENRYSTCSRLISLRSHRLPASFCCCPCSYLWICDWFSHSWTFCNPFARPFRRDPGRSSPLFPLARHAVSFVPPSQSILDRPDAPIYLIAIGFIGEPVPPMNFRGEQT